MNLSDGASAYNISTFSVGWGEDSIGTVNVDTGATFDNGSSSVWLGNQTGAIGTLNVTGPGASFRAGSDLEMGRDEGSFGQANIDGAILESGTYIHVGREGTAEINLINGSELNVGSNLHIGRQATGVGEVYVHGGSTVNVGSDLNLGYIGSGLVEVMGGSTVTVDGLLYVGRDSDADGTLVISGEDSAVIATGGINRIAQSGKGTLIIEEGGRFTGGTSQFRIASSSAGDGEVYVSGADSLLETVGSFSIGDLGTGSMEVSDGASVEVGSWMHIGSSSNAVGNLSITGGGSVTAGNVNPDNAGISIGTDDNTHADVVVSGEDSLLSTTYWIQLARNDNSTATVLVENGGTMISGTSSGGLNWMRIGSEGTATLDVTTGGQVISNNYLGIGFQAGGEGTVNVNTGGLVSAATSLRVGSNLSGDSTGIGTLNIGDGGTVTVDGPITLGEGTGTVNLEGGRLEFSGAFDTSIGDFNWTSGELVVAGGVLLNLDVVPDTLVLEMVDGGVDGTSTTLLGENARIEGSGEIFSTVDLGSNGEILGVEDDLIVSGAVTGNGSLESVFVAGIIHPGQSAGTITLNDVSFLGGGQIVLDIYALIEFDQIIFDGLTSFTDADLNVSFVDFTPSFSDTFELFTFTGGGEPVYDFANISVPEGWMFSNGVLMVIPEPSAFALGIGALALLALRQRRRRA